jgi:hypothetical protein
LKAFDDCMKYVPQKLKGMIIFNSLSNISDHLQIDTSWGS